MPNVPSASHACATVFVIDDDEAVRDSLRLLFELAGLEVRDFASGSDLLDEADRLCSGCLVIDVHMPGMDGIELLERLRRDGVALPALLITGRCDPTLLGRAMSAGARTLVEKPFAREAILGPIRAALAEQADAGGAAHMN